MIGGMDLISQFQPVIKCSSFVVWICGQGGPSAAGTVPPVCMIWGDHVAGIIGVCHIDKIEGR